MLVKLVQTNCVIEFCKVASRDTKFTYMDKYKKVLYRSLYLKGNYNLVFIEKRKKLEFCTESRKMLHISSLGGSVKVGVKQKANLK